MVEDSRYDRPAKDRPDAGQVPSVPLVVGEGGRDGSATESRSLVNKMDDRSRNVNDPPVVR